MNPVSLIGPPKLSTDFQTVHCAVLSCTVVPFFVRSFVTEELISVIQKYTPGEMQMLNVDAMFEWENARQKTD